MKPANNKIKRTIADGLFYLAGSIIYSLSVVVFIAPNRIAPGGVTGVSTLLNYLIRVPIGTTIFILNIPLLIAAWRRLGLDFTIRTSIVTVFVSVLIDIFTVFVPPFHGNIVLVVVFGGVFEGVGLGLIYMRGGTTGGSEVIARLLTRRFPFIPVGRLILMVDAFVVTSAGFIYKNIESSLYAIILIFISTSIMDILIYGRNKGKMLLIVTDHEHEIADEVMHKLHRGVTYLKAAGAYSGKDKQVLFSAVRPSEVYGLRNIVYDIDPHAFVVVISTEEVLGEGFMPFIK